jgi:hypothetical protein
MDRQFKIMLQTWLLGPTLLGYAMAPPPRLSGLQWDRQSTNTDHLWAMCIDVARCALKGEKGARDHASLAMAFDHF